MSTSTPCPIQLIYLHPCHAGGQKFTKLDLSKAYQQLLLEEESKGFTTITTHQGLYRYTRLPFGIASAPAVFQRTMDTILQGIPNVICYIDDILVTALTDEAHLCNLQEVLRRLEDHGFRVIRDKCAFMQLSVEYLGHRVNAQGLHPLESKKDAISQAPEPENLQQLRSYLGLLNYYGRFIPNLATVAHPLHKLLRDDVQWDWSAECACQSFCCYEAGTSILRCPDPLRPFLTDFPCRRCLRVWARSGDIPFPTRWHRTSDCIRLTNAIFKRTKLRST